MTDWCILIYNKKNLVEDVKRYSSSANSHIIPQFKNQILKLIKI